MLPEYIQKRLCLTYCTIRKWPTDLKVYPFSNNTFLTDDYRNICNGEIVSSQKYLRITCFTTIVMVEWWCRYWVGISRAWSRTKRFQWIFCIKSEPFCSENFNVRKLLLSNVMYHFYQEHHIFNQHPRSSVVFDWFFIFPQNNIQEYSCMTLNKYGTKSILT